MRFENITDIKKNVVLAYVKEAIENQRLGKEIKPNKATKTVSIPLELNNAINANKSLFKSFKNLTPGRQREYCEYISEAKRETTKQTRIEKITPLLIKGVGLHDRYKNC